ncbi:MAG TPA: outer membrane beta-barrel family protein, partial [Daejeonella sp.]|nr:outer membrane beta-barrel family protein [Daejeonella sp.]
IRLNGKQNVLVLVDGKQTYMEGQALNDILKSMQGTEIDQIELFNNPTAKFEASGSGSIINIKTKNHRQFGTNGSFNGNSGLSLANHGNDPNFRVGTGLNLNFRNKFISVFGNYTYGDVSQNREIVIERDIKNSLLTAIDVNYQSLSRRLANTYRAGVDIDLSPNHVMGVMVSGSESRLNINKQNRSAIFNQNILDSTIQTYSDQTRELDNIVLNFNYKGGLGKKAGDISFDWDYISYQRSSAELLTNSFLDANENAYRESLLLRNSSPSEFNVQSVKLDYNVSLTKSSTLEAGVQRSHVKGDSRLDFGRMRSDIYYPDVNFTNHFLIDEQIAAAYLNYNINFKKSSLSLGLRAETTRSDGTSVTSGHVNKRDYLNFFPNLQFSQDLKDDHKILFSYSRRITRPGYDNLNPFVAYLDQYSYRAGNPYLKPEFARIAEITHVYKSKFSATLRTKVINDLMLDLNEQNDLTHVSTVISRNIDRQFMYGIELNAPVTLSQWWDVNLNLQSMYEKYTTKSAAGEYKNTSSSFVLNALQSLKFNNNFSAEINGKYESPTIYGIYDYKAAYTVDAAIAKSFFDKNATLRLRVTDLFNTSSNRYTSTYQGLSLTSVERRDSMLGQISFVYLFGRRTVKGARKRDTGSEKEQERIGT